MSLFILRFLLFPFALIYKVITELRNFLYDNKLLSSYRSSIPTILIGNIRVGGTGKTPMIEYLVRYFHSQNKKIAVLSRGYGRTTKGLLVAHPTHTSSEVGDEPYQIYTKFPQIDLILSENRKEGLAYIEKNMAHVNLVLMDDGYQHRAVAPHVSILLTTASDPFWKDYLLPMGMLRESRSQARRADIIITTKCPTSLLDSEIQQDKYLKQLQRYNKQEESLHFSWIQYATPRLALGNFSLAWNEQQPHALVTSIANTAELTLFLGDQMQQHFNFADHHSFTFSDLDKIHFKLKNSDVKSILCTEKDFTKLKVFERHPLFLDYPLFILPIEVMIQEEALFFSYLQQLLKKYWR
ncbi:MAG: tetraacyldisaccharide 4'-kinase [Cyclobacteriaceae bacterium]|nr:tetraacyldisaccharide 4'-kinase [Cyclobacteriaceae bacterium]MCH8517067.1 tetraacyldisaccharide 4'-kinase [Cyclobacteriaceae bacterium]